MSKIKFESEKHLEDFISENRNSSSLKDFLGPWKTIKRQVRLGGYGIADLITLYPERLPWGETMVTANIIELKSVALNMDALGQLSRYMTAVKEVLNVNHVYGTLLAPSVEVTGDFAYILNNLPENIRCFTYSLDLDGFNINEASSNWRLDDVDVTPQMLFKAKDA